MEKVPLFLDCAMALTTALALFLILRATGRPVAVGLILASWAALQWGITRTGFYEVTQILPPRFGLAIGPPLLAIVLLLTTHPGHRFLDSLHPARLHLLHTVRLPVEFILYGLFMSGTVPEVMTFEGRNPDILAGLTAPVIWYFGFRRRILGRTALIAWNVSSLLLLLNIVGHAILSAPSPFQQLAFDQPNIAVLLFPYIWLPSLIVPLVLLAHVSVLRALFLKSVP